MPVLVAGHFNILHPGHIRLFKFARTLESKLIVAVESDRLAGPAAHISEDLRVERLRNSSLVDDAFIVCVVPERRFAQPLQHEHHVEQFGTV